MEMEGLNKYLNIPYKHLGNNLETGIDCFNLVAQIYKDKLNIEIPYTTLDFCNIVDENWYTKTNDRVFEIAGTKEYGWQKVHSPELYDVITMSIGSTNVTNHCAMYLGNNKILHTLQNSTSHVVVYGKYYKQYTMGVHRWIGMKN
jgi:cell wall-associated NlpC family hydrolase